MFAEKDYVNTMIGLIFIIVIGVAFFALFEKNITTIAESVFKSITDQFTKIGAVKP